MFPQVVVDQWLGVPVSFKEEKGDFETGEIIIETPPCANPATYTQATVDELGCIDPTSNL